ncbi:unnamed protein product [Linum trigynum]|uniref:Uncharacterized protein n=1 Tax=Linum trigynum TaxID=586398 RepID=A0AAV2EQX0_9ROSI
MLGPLPHLSPPTTSPTLALRPPPLHPIHCCPCRQLPPLSSHLLGPFFSTSAAVPPPSPSSHLPLFPPAHHPSTLLPSPTPCLLAVLCRNAHHSQLPLALSQSQIPPALHIPW